MVFSIRRVSTCHHVRYVPICLTFVRNGDVVVLPSGLPYTCKNGHMAASLLQSTHVDGWAVQAVLLLEILDVLLHIPGPILWQRL